jgi:MOSC domain-containing protein YiiM
MTTLPQSDLPQDTGVLRAMVAHNRLEIAGKRYPCAGVFAVVMTPGTVRVGDPVELEPKAPA